MSKLAHMRALAVLATVSLTGCSRDCASRSARAEAGKGPSAIERATERGHEGMPETVKYVAANENRPIAVATQVRGRDNPLAARSPQRTLKNAEVEELAAGLDLGKAWVEIERIGGRYVEAGERR